MARSKMATLRSIRANGDDAPKDGLELRLQKKTRTHGNGWELPEWELV